MNLRTLYALGIATSLALTTGCGGAKQLWEGTAGEVKDEVQDAKAPFARTAHDALESLMAGNAPDSRDMSENSYNGLGLEEDKWEHYRDSQQAMGYEQMKRSIVDTVRAIGDGCDMNCPGSPASFGSGYRD